MRKPPTMLTVAINTASAASHGWLPPRWTIPPMTMPFDPTANVPLCLVVVSNPQMNETELYDIAYFELRNKLQSIGGVIAPAVYGGKLRRILAYVDRDDLEARNLSLMEVVQAVQRSNPFVPTGSAKIDAISSSSRATPGVLTSQITGSPHTRRARSKIDSPSRISVSSFSGTTSSATIAMASSACRSTQERPGSRGRSSPDWVSSSLPT